MTEHGKPAGLFVWTSMLALWILVSAAMSIIMLVIVRGLWLGLCWAWSLWA